MWHCSHAPSLCNELGVLVTAEPETGTGSEDPEDFPQNQRQSPALVLSSWVSFLPILAEWEKGEGEGEHPVGDFQQIVQGRKTGQEPKGEDFILFSF